MYVNDQYYALSGIGILSSMDLKTWSLRLLQGGSYCAFDLKGLGLRRILFGNDILTANGYLYLHSHNLIDWSLFNSPEIESNPGIYTLLSFTNDRFFAYYIFGGDNTLNLATSFDGLNWTEFSTVNLSLASLISQNSNSNTNIIYGNGRYVFRNYNTVLSSLDGTVWIKTTLQYPPFTDLTFGNGMFVLVGNNGTILSSSDGISWTLQPSYTSSDLTSIVFGNGEFVAIGQDVVVTSSNGVNWEAHALDKAVIWKAIVYGGGVFVAVGSEGQQGKIMTSSDGKTWALNDTSFDEPLHDVTYANGAFVVAGGNIIMESESIVPERSFNIAAYWNSVSRIC